MARRPWVLVCTGCIVALSVLLGAYRTGRAVAFRQIAAQGGMLLVEPASTCPPCRPFSLGNMGQIWSRDKEDASPDISAPKRRMLIQSGGVPHDGIGSTLKFLKESVSIAHVLDLDVGFTQSALNRDYKVTSLLKADTLDERRLCDLHTIMLEDPSFGPFDVRVARSEAEVDAFRSQVRAHCENGDRGAFELLPHVRERLKDCDVVIWADQKVRIEGSWNPCTRQWIRKALDIVETRRKSVGLHYRWGDISWTTEDKWRYDNDKVEKILRSIKACDPSWEVYVYMEASSSQETYKERAAKMMPIVSYDRLVDTGNGMRDLASLAAHDILILNSGTYSEAAAAASDARLVLWNGIFDIYDYLRRSNDTLLMTIDEGAALDWCKMLKEGLASP